MCEWDDVQVRLNCAYPPHPSLTQPRPASLQPRKNAVGDAQFASEPRIPTPEPSTEICAAKSAIRANRSLAVLVRDESNVNLKGACERETQTDTHTHTQRYMDAYI